MPVMDDLRNEVESTKGQTASIIALVGEFAKYVEAHKTDPVALQQYVDDLKANNQAIADAVAANPDPDDQD
jgi:hypothetical protein